MDNFDRFMIVLLFVICSSWLFLHGVEIDDQNRKIQALTDKFDDIKKQDLTIIGADIEQYSDFQDSVLVSLDEIKQSLRNKK